MSDIAHFVKGSLITSFPMTNREWVTFHILWKTVSSHLFLWVTACEWHCTFCERQSHHIFSYDQQPVSDIAYAETGSLIISFPMTNSLWVTLHILWKAVLSHLFLWPTGSEWNCTCCENLITSFPMTNSQWVTSHFVKGSLMTLITSFPMTNSECVMLHILWKAVSSHLSYDHQAVSDIAHIFCERQSHHICFYD